MSKIAETIRDIEGFTPRVVAELQGASFELEHVRGDVEKRYSDRDLEDAYQLIMANQVTGDDFKNLIGSDQYTAQTLFFGDIIVFLFPSKRYQTVFASFDYDDDFPVNELVRQVSELESG